MPLTVAELREVSFSAPPVGEPGYHPGEVDDLLDRVGAELTRLVEENDELRSQLAQLDAQPPTVSIDPGHDSASLLSAAPVMPVLRPPTSEVGLVDVDQDMQAATMLALAQKVADQVREQAHVTADRMLTQARNHCAQLLSEARGSAQDMVNQARTQVETMVQDARCAAEALQRQSEDKVASLEQQAARQHAEALDALHQKRSVLENTIDNLRGFEQKYRIQLAAHLQSLLHELDRLGLATPKDPSAQQDVVGFGLDAHGQTDQSASEQNTEHDRNLQEEPSKLLAEQAQG
jgi:DivIVA domain-containing protein